MQEQEETQQSHEVLPIDNAHCPNCQMQFDAMGKIANGKIKLFIAHTFIPRQQKEPFFQVSRLKGISGWGGTVVLYIWPYIMTPIIVWLIENALMDRKWPMVIQIAGSTINIGLVGVNTLLITGIIIYALWSLIWSERGPWTCGCGLMMTSREDMNWHMNRHKSEKK